MAKIAAKNMTWVMIAPEPPPLGAWAAAYAISTMKSGLRVGQGVTGGSGQPR